MLRSLFVCLFLSVRSFVCLFDDLLVCLCCLYVCVVLCCVVLCCVLTVLLFVWFKLVCLLDCSFVCLVGFTLRCVFAWLVCRAWFAWFVLGLFCFVLVCNGLFVCLFDYLVV